ncbi:MAG: hypothetical protein U0271_32480 [Polyangiaceae bacterium]
MASGDSTRPNKRGRARADASQAATAPAKLTPVMQQFADAKAQHPDAIVFFRLGDFYEMFFEDAVLASRLLNITLTSRNKEDPNSEPMAGVPHHAAHGYIAKLLAAGHKVALCEQLADPSKVKGIVPRAVVRVITPGLVTDDEQLDARDNHYLAAVEEGAVALLDLSTGELLAGHAPDTTSIVAELCRAAPAEILLAPAMHTLRATLALTLPSSVVRLEQALPAAPDAVLNAELGAEVASDAASALSPLERTAAARAVAFAAACAHGTRLPIRRVGSLDLTARAQIDETALAHLEIVRAADGGRRGSLLDAVDRTVTAGGARLLKRRLLSPLTEVGAIRSRLDDVETFVFTRVRSEVRTGLARVPDLDGWR